MKIERDGRGRDPRADEPAEGGLAAQDLELMRRAKAAFDAEAASLDATTRGRLAAARRAALAELEAPVRRATPAWLPVGAAAAVAIAAVGVALTLRAPQPASPGSAPGSGVVAATMPGSIVALAAEPVTEVELLLGDDELALYAEDPEFVSWAVAETGADDAG